MSEAKEGCALLEDVDEHTLIRFSQYAYTGDYNAADPDIVLDSSMIGETEAVTDFAAPRQTSPDAAGNSDLIAEDAVSNADVERVAEEITTTDIPGHNPRLFEFGDVRELPYGSFQRSVISSRDRKRKGKTAKSDEYGLDLVEPIPSVRKSKKCELWDRFKDRAYTISVPVFHARKNRESCEDYTEVFLCHARLYVFAEKYDIWSLKQLSLHKLQRTLIGFTLYEERVRDVVELMRYSYLNTADRSESVDELRTLVVHYGACVVEHLARSPQFQLLLEEVGQLARDLVAQMIKRLD